VICDKAPTAIFHSQHFKGTRSHFASRKLIKHAIVLPLKKIAKCDIAIFAIAFRIVSWQRYMATFENCDAENKA